MKKTSIGGQALIEGIMMRGPGKMATAVRKTDGEIVTKVEDLDVAKRAKIKKIPLVRGSFVLFEAMISGIKELMYAASFFEDDDSVKEDALDRFLKKVFKDKANDAIIYFSLIISMILSIGIFVIGPSLLTNLLKSVTENSIVLNITEGLIRVVIFIVYLLLISKLDDIKRVFRYHGAEHKTIHCYEHDEELTVENVQKYTTLHPRCGTSFIANVIIISIIVFTFFGWPNPLLRVVIRLVMLPVIAGISYEINRYIGSHDQNKPLLKILAWPGLQIQKITTAQPFDEMVEVAIVAMKEVIPDDGSDEIQ